MEKKINFLDLVLLIVAVVTLILLMIGYYQNWTIVQSPYIPIFLIAFYTTFTSIKLYQREQKKTAIYLVVFLFFLFALLFIASRISL